MIKHESLQTMNMLPYFESNSTVNRQSHLVPVTSHRTAVSWMYLIGFMVLFSSDPHIHARIVFLFDYFILDFIDCSVSVRFSSHVSDWMMITIYYIIIRVQIQWYYMEHYDLSLHSTPVFHEMHFVFGAEDDMSSIGVRGSQVLHNIGRRMNRRMWAPSEIAQPIICCQLCCMDWTAWLQWVGWSSSSASNKPDPTCRFIQREAFNQAVALFGS